jgi:hypothetical protein
MKVFLLTMLMSPLMLVVMEYQFQVKILRESMMQDKKIVQHNIKPITGR